MSDWMSSPAFGPAPNPQQVAMYEAIRERPFSELLSVRKRLCRMEASQSLARAGRASRLPLEFTSQYGEDCWLFELFADQLDGFFIEVGAFDGYRYSVTYPFEALGWKGLLVEPIPDRFEKCRARRPGSRVVNAALGGAGSAGMCTFHVVEGEDAGMLSHLTPTAKVQADVKQLGTKARQVTVPLTTMDDLLAEHKGPIDFAVLDVEGGEIELLKGFDLERHRPKVLLIEEGPPALTSPTKEFMARFPYTTVGYFWINRIYVHNDEKELIKRSMDVPV